MDTLPDPQPSDSQSSEVKPSAATPARNFLRFIYTNNPFYTLSAALVFWGLRRSFHTGGATFETWALIISLAGYTLLLAGTAWFLIRRGSVWQDVRSLLLLVALMFLAISVTFDDALARDWQHGAWFFVGGLLFAISVSEFLLRALPIRLPRLYRAPFYLILALFFLYPVALGPWLNEPNHPAFRWALFGFSSVAGTVFLTLLPAIRRGPAYVNNNGTPWKWPLFPWTLFVLLGLGVCLRSYYLCVSLHFVGGTSSIFGLYFLVPFLWAVAILLLEIGLVVENRWTQRIALLMPLVLLGIGVTNPRPDLVYQQFLDQWINSVGSPLFLTLHAAIAFYVLAVLRHVRGAKDLLIASIAGLAFIGPKTLNAATLVESHGVPLLIAAGAMLWISIKRHESWRAVVAVACVLVAAHVDVRYAWFTAWEKPILLHAALAALLILGAVFNDWWREFLRFAAATLMLAISLAVMMRPEQVLGRCPEELVMAYPFITSAVAVGYAYLVGSRLYFLVAIVSVGGGLALHGWNLYLYLRRRVIGLDQITLGLLFFVLALRISLVKARKSREVTAGQES